jgi:hypothetical protein
MEGFALVDHAAADPGTPLPSTGAVLHLFFHEGSAAVFADDITPAAHEITAQLIALGAADQSVRFLIAVRRDRQIVLYAADLTVSKIRPPLPRANDFEHISIRILSPTSCCGTVYTIPCKMAQAPWCFSRDVPSSQPPHAGFNGSNAAMVSRGTGHDFSANANRRACCIRRLGGGEIGLATAGATSCKAADGTRRQSAGCAP